MKVEKLLERIDDLIENNEVEKIKVLKRVVKALHDESDSAIVVVKDVTEAPVVCFIQEKKSFDVKTMNLGIESLVLADLLCGASDNIIGGEIAELLLEDSLDID